MSEASSAEDSSSPTTSGAARRAATIAVGLVGRDGGHRERPASLASTARSASASGRPAATSSSRRWARTSVSVSEASRCPRATSPSASSVWFSMIPLCTTASRPVQSRWGWAFSGVGLPWVAQRVWPIAVRRPGGAARQRPASVVHRVGPLGGPGPPEVALGHQGHAGRVVAAVLEAVEAVEQTSSASAAPVAPMIPHTGRRLPTRRGRPPPSASSTAAHSRAGPSPAAWTAVTASTITRTTGSVPLGRSSTRPVSPSSASASATARQTTSAPSAVARVGHGHVHQDLGDPLDQAGRELGQGPARPHHQVGQDQAGQDPVAGSGPVAEDDVAGLLAAQGEPLGLEGGQHVAVAHRGLAHGDAPLGHGQAEPEVGHHRDHHGVAGAARRGPPGPRRTGPAGCRRRPPPRCGRRPPSGRRRRRGRSRGRPRRPPPRRPGTRVRSSRSASLMFDPVGAGRPSTSPPPRARRRPLGRPRWPRRWRSRARPTARRAADRSRAPARWSA